MVNNMVEDHVKNQGSRSRSRLTDRNGAKSRLWSSGKKNRKFTAYDSRNSNNDIRYVTSKHAQIK